MEFDKKNILTIGLAISLGLNIILAFFVFQDKILFADTPTVIPNTSLQQEERSEPSPVQENTSEPEISVEKEYVIPIVRQNDPSNDAWMIRKWDGVYSNPEREFFSSDSGSENVWPANRNKFHNYQCPELNTEKPDSYVIFENEELLIRLPFNEKWGGDIFKLTPYVSNPNKTISFGPLMRIGEGWDGEGCFWHHDTPLEILPKQEKSKYLLMLQDRIKNNNDVFNIKLVDIPSSKIDTEIFSIIQYEVSGIEGFSVLAFFTDTHVYEFSGGVRFFSVDMLQDIISTIELK